MKKITGGGRIGPSKWMGYGATWPLSSLQVEADRIIFRVPGVHYEFARREIVHLVRHRILGFRALRIVHTRPVYQRWVLFFPLKFGALEKMLADAGFRIEDSNSAVVEPSIVYCDSLLWPSVIVGVLAAGLAIFAFLQLK